MTHTFWAMRYRFEQKCPRADTSNWCCSDKNAFSIYYAPYQSVSDDTRVSKYESIKKNEFRKNTNRRHNRWCHCRIKIARHLRYAKTHSPFRRWCQSKKKRHCATKSTLQSTGNGPDGFRLGAKVKKKNVSARTKYRFVQLKWSSSGLFSCKE